MQMNHAQAKTLHTAKKKKILIPSYAHAHQMNHTQQETTNENLPPTTKALLLPTNSHSNHKTQESI